MTSTEELAKRLVDREVYACLSSLVSTLNCGVIYRPGEGGTRPDRDLQSLIDQASELAAPIDDYESTATEAGWQVRHDMGGFYACTDEEAAFEDAGNPSVGFDGREHWAEIEDAWRNICEAESIEPYQREVFEHWAISQQLGENLQSLGEKVDFDFAGLVVWARTTSGQVIYADSVMERVAEIVNAA